MVGSDGCREIEVEVGGREEAGGGGKDFAGTKWGRSVPTDSTPHNNYCQLSRQREGGRDSGGSPPAGENRKGPPVSEGSPITITEAHFPRVQHLREMRGAHSPPRHQRSIYIGKSKKAPPRPLREPLTTPQGASCKFYVKICSPNVLTVYTSKSDPLVMYFV